MENASGKLILAVPGTHETQELPRDAVLAAVRSGDIAPDHWVWSFAHNEWKHASEHPELQEIPDVVQIVEPEPILDERHAVPANSLGYAIPRAGNAHVSEDSRSKWTDSGGRSQDVKVDEAFSFFKLISLIPVLIIIGVILSNYFLVDQPFADNLAATRFNDVSAYAHLGAFAQPNALVIHILPTRTLNQNNFADFLFTIAKSAPNQPFNHKPFDLVGLTDSWQSQYIFEGADWVELRKMEGSSPEDKMKFEIEHLEYADGSALIKNHKSDDPTTRSARQTRAWQILVAGFLSKPS